MTHLVSSKQTSTVRIRVVLIVAALVALGGLGWSLANASPRTAEEQVRDVAGTLRCPTCAAEDVADSAAPVAVAMRQVIADQVQEGRSPGQIRAWFVERYGDAILLDPPRRGLGWLLWVVPALLFVGMIVLMARRWGAGSRRAPLIAAVGVLAFAVVATSWELLGVDRRVPLTTAQPAVNVTDVLQDAAGERPGDIQLQITAARALAGEGRSIEAVDCYAAAYRLRPLDADLASLYALELLRSGNSGEATRVLQHTLAGQPDHDESLLLLGTLRHRAGEPDGAAMLEKFLELAPRHPGAEEVRRLLLT